MKFLIKTTLLLFTLIFTNGKLTVLAQTTSIKLVDSHISTINADTSLILKEFNATEIYKHSFDGGGIIKLFKKADVLIKIEQKIFLSFGPITTTIYFNDGHPIKIIDKEENFAWNENEFT